MAWSYSGEPDSSPKDAVRVLTGDTNQRQPLLQDGEINWVLRQFNYSPTHAAIRCCELIIAKFSRMADESVGQVSISYGSKAENMRKLLGDLRARLAMDDCMPFAGGISISQKVTNAQNTDRVPPDFTKLMMDNPNVSPFVSNGLPNEGWFWGGNGNIA